MIQHLAIFVHDQDLWQQVITMIQHTNFLSAGRFVDLFLHCDPFHQIGELDLTTHAR